MYKEYHKCWYLMVLSKRDLEASYLKIDAILSELSKTASELKDTTTTGSHLPDKMGSLISSKIDLENIIEYQKDLFDSRNKRVEQKLEELKKSKDLSDIIYLLKFVSKFKVKEVAKVVSYSREYTYDLISKIREQMKIIENEINESMKKKNANF